MIISITERDTERFFCLALLESLDAVHELGGFECGGLNIEIEGRK